jgi:hypothetical protein
MMMIKSKTFLRLWISKLKNINKVWPSVIARPFLKIMDPVKQLIHQLNADANRVNKAIVQPSSTMNPVPMDKTIYQPTQQPVHQPIQQPVQQQPVPVNHVAPVQQPVAQPLVDEKVTKEFIDRLTSVEKKIDRFFNLIEKRVVKNAKEVIIRIKLNENSNSEQE